MANNGILLAKWEGLMDSDEIKKVNYIQVLKSKFFYGLKVVRPTRCSVMLPSTLINKGPRCHVFSSLLAELCSRVYANIIQGLDAVKHKP